MENVKGNMEEVCGGKILFHLTSYILYKALEL